MFYKLNEKYNTLTDDILMCPTQGSEKWIKDTSSEIKLLSILSCQVDGNLMQHFTTDDRLYSALENEYYYAGYSFSRTEIPTIIHKLHELGFLDKIN